MILSVTYQQANQIAAALRIFQALRQTGEGFRVVDGEHVTIAEMEHFEQTEPLADEEIDQMIDKAYEGAAEPEVAEAQEAIARIAARNLGIGTLDTRHSDALDFHDLSVDVLRRALEAAYEAGRRRGAC